MLAPTITFVTDSNSASYVHAEVSVFDPNTGKDFSTLQLEKNIEASPAVYNNMLVVGTYAKKLYGIRIS